MKTASIIIHSAAATMFAGSAPTTNEVVARMMERDQQRQTMLRGYSWTSRYVLDNKQRHAEMVVRWTRNDDGSKRYEIVSETGDGGVRGHVFHKLLESEVEAGKPALQERNRMNSKNYAFQLAGTEEINGRLAYVLEVEPKAEAKYLTRGRIWVDAADYAIVQVQGSPSKKPSFWTNSVSFTQTYEKTGDFWMAASNRSVTEAKIFGKADLVIRHSEYSIGAMTSLAAE